MINIWVKIFEWMKSLVFLEILLINNTCIVRRWWRRAILIKRLNWRCHDNMVMLYLWIFSIVIMITSLAWFADFKIRFGFYYRSQDNVWNHLLNLFIWFASFSRWSFLIAVRSVTVSDMIWNHAGAVFDVRLLDIESKLSWA